MKARLVILILYMGIFFLLWNYYNSRGIPDMFQQEAPSSKKLNAYFGKLYEKFGGGKAVPYKFVGSTKVIWAEIYENFETLLED